MLYKGIYSQNTDFVYHFDIDISTKHQILFNFDFNNATTGTIRILTGDVEICNAYSYGYFANQYVSRWIINKMTYYLTTDSSGYRTTLYNNGDLSDGLRIIIDNNSNKPFAISFYVA